MQPVTPRGVRRYGRRRAFALASLSVVVGVAMATPATPASAATTAFVSTTASTAETSAVVALPATTTALQAETVYRAALAAAQKAALAAAWRTTATYLSSNRTAVTAGASVTFTGRVTSDGTQTRVPSQTVTLQSRGANNTWRTVATKKTSSGGYVTFTVKPAASTTYRLLYAGAQPLAASTSSTRTVSVAKAVSTPKATTTAKATTKAAAAPAASAVTAGTGRGAAVVAAAASQTGKPYSWGSAGPSSYDCSGLTMYAFKKVGISLPHNANAQKSYGTAVSRAAALPGDLVIFVSGGYGYHAGIYVGNGYMIDAPTQGTTVGRHQIWSSNVVFRRLV